MRRQRHENREHRKAIKLARRRQRLAKQLAHRARLDDTTASQFAKLLTRNRRLI